MPSFDEIGEDFLRITTHVVWATVATVDTRPSAHPDHASDLGGGRRAPAATCRWLTGRPSRRPWKEGPSAGVFAALRLDPWRVLILSAEDAAAGRWYQRYWQEG